HAYIHGFPERHLPPPDPPPRELRLLPPSSRPCSFRRPRRPDFRLPDPFTYRHPSILTTERTHFTLGSEPASSPSDRQRLSVARRPAVSQSRQGLSATAPPLTPSRTAAEAGSSPEGMPRPDRRPAGFPPPLGTSRRTTHTPPTEPSGPSSARHG